MKEEKMEMFYKMVLDFNKKVNITTITEREEFFIKHVNDSLAGEKHFIKGAKVVEVGSGGGFPSVPLKIIREDLDIVQIESIRKKCTFLEEVSKKLELDIKTVNIRAEDAGKDEQYREKFDVSCARAVARLNTLLEYCAPFVKKGGIVIAYKGICDEEIKQAENAAKKLGCQLEKYERYSLPCGMGERSLVIYKKIASTPLIYPRGHGKERSNPL